MPLLRSFRVQTITMVSDCASVCDSPACFTSDLRDSENNDEIHCNHLPQSGPQAACEPNLQFVGELQDFPGDILDASFREAIAPSAAASPSSYMSSWCDLCESENNYEIRCNHLQSGPLRYDMSYSDDDSDWVHASVSEDAMCILPECPQSFSDLPSGGTVSSHA